MMWTLYCIFFFQAEDGIRYSSVTGVQTCALPIFPRTPVDSSRGTALTTLLRQLNAIEGDFWIRLLYTHPAHWSDELIQTIAECPKVARSEERRVGKECRSRWSPYH